MKIKQKHWFFLTVLVVVVLGAAINTWFLAQKHLQAIDLGEITHRQNHQVRFLDIGRNALAARMALIRQAKRSISIQTFIWTDDEAGRLLVNELLKAAKRGVQVKIIADQMFSNTDPKAIAAVVTESPNLKVKHYNPITSRIKTSTLENIASLATDFEGVNQRMHNKVFIVDETWAITGGRNIENTYYDYQKGLNFKDRDILVNGPVVKDMQNSFNTYWNFPLAIRSQELKDIAKAIKSSEQADLSVLENSPLQEEMDSLLAKGTWQKIKSGMFTVSKVAFLADKPGKISPSDQEKGARITRQFMGLVLKAKKSIVIQSPYLVFGERGIELFKDLNEKGIKLAASTNSLAATDSWPTYAMFYKQKKKLIEDLGMRLYEFKPLPGDIDKMFPDYRELKRKMIKEKGKSMGCQDLESIPYFCLHAKSMVIDRKLVCIGSYNFDPRSANINTEVALVVWDKKLAQQLDDNIKLDIHPDNSWVIWKRQRPLGLEYVSGMMEFFNEQIEGVTSIDLWPARHTACFELKPGKQPVDPENRLFYENYQSVGNFPMVPETDEKQIYTRLFKAFGKALIPIL